MKALRIMVALFAMSAMLIAQDAPKPEKPHTRTYLLDFTLTELEDGKKVNTRTYSARLVGSPGEQVRIKQGMRVPILTKDKEGQPTTTYLDIGFQLYGRIMDDMANVNPAYFAGGVEMSGLVSPDEQSRVAPNGPPMMRSMQYNLSSTLTPGKSVRLLDVDEADGKRRLQIDLVYTIVN